MKKKKKRLLLYLNLSCCWRALGVSQPWGSKMDKMSSWSTFLDLFLQVYEQNKMNSRCFPRRQQIKEPFLWILHRLNKNKMNPTSGPFFFFFISLKNRYNNTIDTHKNQAGKIKSRVPQILLSASFWNGKRLKQKKPACPTCLNETAATSKPLQSLCWVLQNQNLRGERRWQWPERAALMGRRSQKAFWLTGIHDM